MAQIDADTEPPTQRPPTDAAQIDVFGVPHSAFRIDTPIALPPLWRDPLFWLTITLTIFAVAPFLLPGYFWGANDRAIMSIFCSSTIAWCKMASGGRAEVQILPSGMVIRSSIFTALSATFLPSFCSTLAASLTRRP